MKINLKEFRKQRNISQEEIAKLFGITQSAISRKEAMKSEINDVEYEKLCNIYGKDIVDRFKKSDKVINRNEKLSPEVVCKAICDSEVAQANTYEWYGVGAYDEDSFMIWVIEDGAEGEESIFVYKGIDDVSFDILFAYVVGRIERLVPRGYYIEQDKEFVRIRKKENYGSERAD